MFVIITFFLTSQCLALPLCIFYKSKNFWNNCFGTYTYANGNNYQGEFKYGKFNGQGNYFSLDGKIKKGIFKDDKFLFERDAG